MAVTFAVRGDSVNARYSSDGKTPGVAGTVTSEADATAIGATRLNLYQGAIGVHQLKYVGRYNLPSANTISILIRYAPSFTGSPGSNMGIFEFGSNGAINTSGTGLYSYLGANHLVTGDIKVIQQAEDNTAGIANVAVKTAWSPTSGVWYDLVWTYTGGTTNAFKFYIDGSLQTTTSSASGWPNPRTQELAQALTFGAGSNVRDSGYYINEIVIWDTVIDPTSVTLTSGTGSLNGASRTAFVDAASFDGRSNSAPTAANVKTGTAYTVAGTAYVGTYEGTDRHTDPGVANVTSGVEYKSNSTTNNRTGTATSVAALETKLTELWKVAGLDVANPMTVTPTRRTAGTVDVVLTGDGITSTTATRQP